LQTLWLSSSLSGHDNSHVIAGGPEQNIRDAECHSADEGTGTSIQRGLALWPTFGGRAIGR